MPSTNPISFSFHPATSELLSLFSSKREGEERLAETIQIGEPNEETKFILLGIEESIGPQANRGLSGAENAFNAFFKRFINMQSNRFVSGKEILFIGTIKQTTAFTNEKDARLAIEQLDQLVEDTLAPYLKEKNIPIVIGGGHNNAYPIIKSISKHSGNAINVVNLDPHADCRALEGRHSGNPFSYAKKDGYLNHYSVIGLHKAYNSEFLLNYLDENGFYYSFFEDYIADPSAFEEDIHTVSSKLANNGLFGLELDLDALKFMPSSAFTPSGFTVEQARRYLSTFANLANCCYLHLPEGAPTNENEEKIIGKTLAFLVWDFIVRKSGN